MPMTKIITFIFLTTFSLKAFALKEDSTRKYFNLVVKGDILTAAYNLKQIYKGEKYNSTFYRKTNYFFGIEKMFLKNKSIQVTCAIKPWNRNSNNTWYKISADYKYFVSKKRSYYGFV